MTYQDLSLPGKCLQDRHQVHIIRFIRILSKYRNRIPTGKNQSIKIIFMPYKICNHIIGHQFNARVCFNFLCFRHCIHLIGYTIFKKRFQILEQTESVHRIYR